MPTVHFLGKILPSTAYKVSTEDLPQMAFTPADKAFTVRLSIFVNNSAVDVECVIDRLDADIMVQTHKIAYDHARAITNLFALSTGISLSVIFDEFTDANGVTSPFVIQDLSLAPLCTSFSLNDTDRPTSLSQIMNLVFVEPPLWLALDDLITASSVHSLITVNSARAIEALRHAMATPGMSRNDAWELFRTNLKVTKDYLSLITDTSQSSRHGDPVFIPGPVTTEIIRRARTIMNRFLEFRKRKNQPLDTTEFPVLDK